MKRTNKIRRRRQEGLTLIELLVAVVIGLVVVLAATNVLVIGESHKRTTNSNNDMSQSGAFAAYTLDRAVRSAGSGFSQAWDQGVFGCLLSAARSGAAILPRAAAFPVPFAGFLGSAPGTLRLAPVLVGQNQSAGGSDVLVLMSGNGAAGDAARQIRSGVTGTNNLRMDNTIGFQNADLGLVTQPGNSNCLLEQVNVTDTAAFALSGNEVLPLGSTYLNTNANLATMAASGNAFFSTVGNATAQNVQFQLFGVGTDRTLYAYDLLRSAATAGVTDPVLPLADGVLELHAMYGISPGPPYTNVFSGWVAPKDDWAIAAVMADPVKQRRIVAIRIAIVMKSATYEKEDVTLERPVLFANTPGEIAAIPYVAGTDDRHYRLQVIDTSIPLRNILLLPTS